MTQGPLSKSLHGMKWSATSTVINISFQILFMAVMARLLEPSDFGLMAMANIAMRFVSYFVEMGVGPALVQKLEVTDDDIRVSFSISFLLGCGFYVLTWLLAPVAGLFFHNTNVVSVLRVSGLATVSVHLLRRRLRFRDLAVIESASYIIGYGVCGMSLALMGFGVWSLVFALLGQMFVTLLIAYFFIRHKLSFNLNWKGVKHFYHFGSRYSVIGFLEFIGANLDSIFIGRMLGDALIGIYNRASMLTNLPIELVINSLTKVLFPILSEIQTDKKKVGQAYILFLFLVGAFVSAVCFGMIPVARDIVLTLLGAKWEAVIPVMQILAIAVPFVFLSHIHGVIFDSQAALGTKLKIQAMTVLVLGATIYLFSEFGLRGFAISVVIAEIFRFICFLIAMRSLLVVSSSDLVRVFSSVILIFTTTTTLLWITVWGLDLINLSVVVRLIIVIPVGAVSLLLVLSIVWRRLGLIEAFRVLEHRLPVLQYINRFGQFIYKTEP
jgi:lipopolysaccharide exporter